MPTWVSDNGDAREAEVTIPWIHTLRLVVKVHYS